MGNFNSSIDKQKDRDKQDRHRTVDIQGIKKLKHDINKYGNSNLLLQLTLNEVHKYINNIELFTVSTDRMIEIFECNRLDLTENFIMKNKKNINSMSYETELSDTVNFNSLIIPSLNMKTSIISIISEFINGIRKKDDFHQALDILKNNIHHEWIEPHILNNYMMKYSLIKGHNKIYCNMLKMIQHWIQFVLTYSSEQNHQIDHKLQEIADKYLNMSIKHIIFDDINQYITTSTDLNTLYNDTFGNVLIYFYITESNIMTLDVSHEYYDHDQKRMKQRLNNDNEFDWTDYDPLRLVYIPYRRHCGVGVASIYN